MFRSRHRIGLKDTRFLLRVQVGQARDLCARLIDERAVFRAALETRAEWVCAGGNGWLSLVLNVPEQTPVRLNAVAEGDGRRYRIIPLANAYAA